MPFTLAHPAAVLPLRRLCPRYFNFPALVAGSIAPDAGYCFGSLHLEEVSHSAIGSVEFCLPVGLVMLGFFYGLRGPVADNLPERQRQLFAPLCRRPMGSVLVLVVSLMAGISLHLLLDSFTHRQGWLVQHWPLLQASIFSVGAREFRIFNLLWCLGSFVGLAWLLFAWDQWRNATAEMARPANFGRRLGKAALISALMLPVALVHYLLPGAAGLALTAGLCLLVALVMAWKNAGRF